jgi:hypothetical protein
MARMMGERAIACRRHRIVRNSIVFNPDHHAR